MGERFRRNKTPKVYTFRQRLAKLRKKLIIFIVALFLSILSLIIIFAEEFNRGSQKYFNKIAEVRITNTGGLTEKSISRLFEHSFVDLHNFSSYMKDFDLKTDGHVDENKVIDFLDSTYLENHLDDYGIIMNDKIIFSSENQITLNGEFLLTDITEDYVFKMPNIEPNNLYFASPAPEGFDEIKGIIGIIDINSFNSEIETNVYNNQANVIVIKSNGDTIAVYSINNKDWYGNNLFQDIANNYSRKDYDKLDGWILNPNKNVLDIGSGKSEIMLYKSELPWGDETGKFIFILSVPKGLLTNQVISLTNISLTALYISLVLGTLIITALVILLAHQYVKTERKKAYGPKSGLLTEDYFFHDAQAILFHDESPFGLISMNIKGFKKINEIYGADVADDLLGEVGRAVNDYFADKDDDIAGYQRGDNYMLLLKGNEDEILYKLTSLDYELTNMKFLDETKLNFSYGIKVTSSKFALDLYKELDKAKFAEKQNKAPNENYFFFDEEMEKRQQEIDDLNTKFEEALANEEFEVFFQLKWDLRMNDWGGAEALVRWRSPEKGLIPPGKFIPLYEDNGNVTKLDAYVFEKTCKLISEMLDNGERVVPVSINLSKRNFANMTFMPVYQAIVEKYKIPHELIEFEITEGLLMENLEAYTKFIRIFHENDYGIAMDDFGSGYSSLNMIHNLDFDVIKIDAKFFRDGFNESSKTIVKSIISLCHKLGKTVVAEGIEHSHEVDFLRDAKCDIIQGYYFAKPLPFDDFKKLLATRPNNT